MNRLEAINKAIILAEEASEDPLRMLTILATAVVLICDAHNIPIEVFLDKVILAGSRKSDDDSE